MSLLLRQLIKTAGIQATGHLSDGPLVFTDYVLRVLRVTILLALWRTVLWSRA